MRESVQETILRVKAIAELIWSCRCQPFGEAVKVDAACFSPGAQNLLTEKGIKAFVEEGWIVIPCQGDPEDLLEVLRGPFEDCLEF